MSHSCINYIGKNAFPQNCQGDGSDQGDGSAGLIAGRVPAAFSYTLLASLYIPASMQILRFEKEVFISTKPMTRLIA